MTDHPADPQPVPSLRSDSDLMVVDRDRLVRSSIFTVDNFFLDNPLVRTLTNATQSRLTVEVAIGYLLYERLITAKPENECPEWLSVGLPPHLKPDVTGELTRYAKMLDGPK